MLSLLQLSSACVCQALQPSTPTAAVVLSVLFSFLACQPEVLAWLSESQPWISSYVTLTVLNRILVQRAAAPSIGHDTCTDCSSPVCSFLGRCLLEALVGEEVSGPGPGVSEYTEYSFGWWRQDLSPVKAERLTRRQTHLDISITRPSTDVPQWFRRARFPGSLVLRNPRTEGICHGSNNSGIPISPKPSMPYQKNGDEVPIEKRPN